MSYSNDMYREIILDHVDNPRNKNKDHDGYYKKTLKNPSCGDIVTVYSKINNNKITDVTYEVSGCSICSASVSIMSELMINKSINEAREIVNNFNQMMMNEQYDENMLGDAICLKGVATIPARIKCATLGYKAFLETVDLNGGDYNEK